MRIKWAGVGVVIVAGITFYMYSQFMSHSKKKIPVARLPVSEEQIRDKPENLLSDATESAHKNSFPEKTWGRDPFKLPSGVELRVAERGNSVNAEEAPVKKLTAILITDSQRVASINHKVVAVGDVIDGERVMEIKHDRVILQKHGRKQVIMLDESPIQWTKNKKEPHE